MNFSFSEDQVLLKNSVRAALDEQCKPAHVRAMMEDATGYREALWGEMAKLGWLGLPFPEEQGGAGLGLVELCLVLEELGRAAYPGPYFASVVLGGLGFARWANEVAAQERELSVSFDTVVVCSVTGSTQAGMVAGFAVQETDRAVLGIDGSATVAQTWAQIARIARATAEAIELGRELDDSEIVLLDEWHAGTYGIPDEKTIDAIRLCARLEGVLTDPVYEGKSMAALIDLVRSERIAPGSRVLYAHLGGQPALNAYAGVF